MPRRLLVLLILILCIATIACRPLPSPPDTPEPQLLWEELPSLDSIPLEYGDFIAVTADPEDQHLSTLWFERLDGAIVAVKVDHARGGLYERALVIPRR